MAKEKKMPEPPRPLEDLVREFKDLRDNVVPMHEKEVEEAQADLKRAKERLEELKMQIAEEIGISIDDYD